MSNSLEDIKRKIKSAGEVGGVVRAMKALTASYIGQYEAAVRSSNEYFEMVSLGFSAFLTASENNRSVLENNAAPAYAVYITIGSDQGLVGQFNHQLAGYVKQEVGRSVIPAYEVWAVGARLYMCLEDEHIPVRQQFSVPVSVASITSLVSDILLKADAFINMEKQADVYVCYNTPIEGAMYEQVTQKLLPIDTDWLKKRKNTQWPTNKVPEFFGDREDVMSLLIYEYLFISLYRYCAESLASENKYRLAAMQRAEKNIDELKERLHHEFHRMRQETIDEELFDLISGFEALSKKTKK